MKIQILFRSGSHVTIEVDEWEMGKLSTNSARSVTWTSPDDWAAKLLSVDVGEIVAVVALRDEWEIADARRARKEIT